MPAVLDTHAAVWYLLDSTRLPEPVYSLIDSAAAEACQLTFPQFRSLRSFTWSSADALTPARSKGSRLNWIVKILRSGWSPSIHTLLLL